MAVNYYVLAGAVVIDSTNNTYRVTEDGSTSFDVVLPDGTIFVYGDGSEATDFCKVLADTLDAESAAHGAGYTHTVSFTAKTTEGGRTGVVTITTTGTSLAFVGSHGNTTADMRWIGYQNGGDTGPFTSYTGIGSVSTTWCSDQPPAFIDPGPRRRRITQRETVSGDLHTHRTGARLRDRILGMRKVCRDRVWEEEADLAFDNARAFEAWIEECGDGRQVRLYQNTASAGNIATLDSTDLMGTFIVLAESAENFDPERLSRNPLYNWDLALRRVS